MNDKTSEQQRDLFDRKPVRYALFVVIPAVIFVLVCAGIRVSQYGINHTIVVVGQRQLLAGSPAALRVTLIADDQGFFLPDRIAGYLVRDQDRHLLFDGAALGAGYALARNFRVPEMAAGPAVLELDIEFDERQRLVRTEVDIVEEAPAAELIVPSDTDLEVEPVSVIKDGVRITALTEDRGAPTGLTSVLFLRALRQGQPESVEVELSLPGEPGSEPSLREYRTDRLGIAALALKPFEMSAPIRVQGARPMRDETQAIDGDAAVETDDGYLFPRVTYGGITVAMHEPIVNSDMPLRFTAMQISKGGPLYAEVFQDGRLVLATSGWMSGAAAEIDIHPPLTGLLRIQFTTSALAPGNTVTVRHAYVLKKGESLDDGLRAILEHLTGSADERAWAKSVSAMPLERGGFDRRAAAAFTLSRLYAGHQVVPRLISSRKEDDAELAAFKTSFQRYVMLTIILVGVGVALLIAMIAFQSHRRMARLSLMIVDNEDDQMPEPDWKTDVGAKGARHKVVFQAMILLLILIGAFASIALLVDTLTWGR